MQIRLMRWVDGRGAKLGLDGPLQRYLDEGNAHVSVGAGHLSGRAGLIRLLEQAGYRNEAMK